MPRQASGDRLTRLQFRLRGRPLRALSGQFLDIGVPGTAERVFSALHRADISVAMISQSSSEHSIGLDDCGLSGIDPHSSLGDQPEGLDLDRFVNFIDDDHLPHAVNLDSQACITSVNAPGAHLLGPR